MWHTACLLFLLGLGPSQAQVYSEGGRSLWPADPQQQSPPADPEALERIVDELKALRNVEQFEPAAGQFPAGSYPSADWQNEAEDEPNPEEMAKIGRDLQQLLREHQQTANNDNEQWAEESANERSQPERPEQPSELLPKQPLTAQKKGQFEYVEFVEPHAAKAMRNVEFMDKRAPMSEVLSDPTRQLLYGSNNVFFVVAVTVCCVATVFGVVGGAYYFNTVRKQRAEAFDDFTRYSPAGPGRDMLRKGRGFAGSPVLESGDDALAKAAHLHHFEQTKQKIIGEDNGIVHDDQSDKSDDEADDLEAHNFSIYECPGLAPTTGDIEVQNPNFAQRQP